ncbi:hypothetical protein [Streptomyces sp. NPDC058694]|uniref:hypothetical protein n=1 Tax=Streptomyces sp. NPDC058694 TaxID=3346603 RepID=UPI00365C8282
MGLVYDVHHLADGLTPNPDFVDLAARVDKAVAPLQTPAPSHAEHRFDRVTLCRTRSDDWTGH